MRTSAPNPRGRVKHLTKDSQGDNAHANRLVAERKFGSGANHFGSSLKAWLKALGSRCQAKHWVGAFKVLPGSDLALPRRLSAAGIDAFFRDPSSSHSPVARVGVRLGGCAAGWVGVRLGGSPGARHAAMVVMVRCNIRNYGRNL